MLLYLRYISNLLFIMLDVEMFNGVINENFIGFVDNVADKITKHLRVYEDHNLLLR